MSLRAIIFDFDGVIADTEALHLRAYQEALAPLGIELPPQEYYLRYLGLDDGAVIRAVARANRLSFDDTRLATVLEDKSARYGRLIARTAPLYDGVERRVREWSREVPLAVASGALKSEIVGILGRHQLLDCFAAIVSAEDVARGKPAPDGYVAALAALNARAGKAGALPHRSDMAFPRGSDQRCGPIEARHTVVIEDSLPGIEAATAAGMRTVAVTTNHSARALAAAEMVVPSVASLELAALRALASAE